MTMAGFVSRRECFDVIGRDVIDPTRLARAIHLDCKRMNPSSFRVSGGEADHIVEVANGRVVCDCYDAQYHGDGCKHSLIVRLIAGDQSVVKALRKLVAPPPRLRRVA